MEVIVYHKGVRYFGILDPEEPEAEPPLKVGDYVQYVGPEKFVPLGAYGKVIVIVGERVGVEFAHYFVTGHTLDERCGCGHGRWFSRLNASGAHIADLRKVE